MTPASTRTHYRTCHLCEAMCGLRIETEGERVTSIRGDDEDPLSRGFLCPKGPALAALHEDPDRLRHPMRKVGSRFERIGWDDALDLAAEGLHRAQTKYGKNAIATYLGNPNVHSLPASLFAPMLVRAIGSHNRYSASSVDQLPHHVVANAMLGHQFLLPVPDLDRTGYMLIVGANPLASNGSLMTAPNVRERLRRIGERGGKVVVLDPRRTETAKLAAEHHFVRPGQDAFVLAAVLGIAMEQGRGPGRLAPHVERLDALRDALAPFTSELAAERSGLDAGVIERLARELCAAERAVVYGRMGTSTQRFGTVCTWLVTAINIVTGNFDREGGAMLTKPALDAVSLPFGLGVGKGGVGRWKSRVRGLPEAGSELPVATLADEILTEGEGQVRALVTCAGNPVLSTPNGARLDRALAGLEHMVSIDFYLNETTRHATVILPPPSPLERPHYDAALHHLAVRNTTKLSPAIFRPPVGALEEHEILLGVVERLASLRGRRRDRLRAVLMRRLGPIGMVDLALRMGPHGPRAWPPRAGLSARALLRHPHGLDLGPLEPCLPERMRKWKDKIDVAPARFVEDLDRLREERPVQQGALLLIGRRHLRSNNSWMHNLPKLVAGKELCTLMIHPEDARARGLADGELARVSSRTGAIRAPVEVTEDVMRGVVSLPHGFGHDREGTALSVARAHAGASINDLTDELELDVPSGNAALSGVEVRVEPG